MGLNSSLEPSRVENLLQLETGEKAERKVREIQSKRVPQPTNARGRPHESMRKNAGSLYEQRLASSKEAGPQSYTHEEASLTNNLNRLGSRFILRASAKKPSLDFGIKRL